jgi:hypothetical protein
MSDATPSAGGHPFPPPPPPTGGKPSGCLKYGLIGCGVLIVLMILLGVAGYLWFRGSESGLEEAGREGARAGIGIEEAECIPAGAERAGEAGGLTSAMAAGVWMRACLEHSRETPGFCDDVPPPTAIRRTAEWRSARCGGDAACESVMPVVQAYCAEGRPKRIPADTLDWATGAAGPAPAEDTLAR